MDFIRCIEARLEELGLKPSSAEKRFDLPPDTIRNVIRAGSKTDHDNAGPTLSKLIQICDALDIEFYIGPQRPLLGAKGFAEAAEKFLSIDGDRGAFSSGYLPIPFHHADLAHRDMSPLALSRTWLEAQGLDTNHVFAVVMPNDDMSPIIQEGAQILIDTRYEPDPKAELCAFTVDNHIRVGWLVLPSGGCLVGFFHRRYSAPAIMSAKSGRKIVPLGRVVVGLDAPSAWLDREEKNRLFHTAKDLVSRQRT